MTVLDLSHAPSLRGLWRPGMAVEPEVRQAMAYGYRPGPVQHRRAATVAFDPTTLSGAQIVLDARRADLQWTDTAGTTLSTTNGDLIAR